VIKVVSNWTSAKSGSSCSAPAVSSSESSFRAFDSSALKEVVEFIASPDGTLFIRRRIFIPEKLHLLVTVCAGACGHAAWGGSVFPSTLAKRIGLMPYNTEVIVI
jgi:hypothetical protein